MGVGEWVLGFCDDNWVLLHEDIMMVVAIVGKCNCGCEIWVARWWVGSIWS